MSNSTIIHNNFDIVQDAQVSVPYKLEGDQILGLVQEINQHYVSAARLSWDHSPDAYYYKLYCSKGKDYIDLQRDAVGQTRRAYYHYRFEESDNGPQIFLLRSVSISSQEEANVRELVAFNVYNGIIDRMPSDPQNFEVDNIPVFEASFSWEYRPELEANMDKGAGYESRIYQSVIDGNWVCHDHRYDGIHGDIDVNHLDIVEGAKQDAYIYLAGQLRYRDPVGTAQNPGPIHTEQWLYKIDSDGSKIWGKEMEVSRLVACPTDGCFIAQGNDVIRLNSEGEVIGTLDELDSIDFMLVDNDCNLYIVSGSTLYKYQTGFEELYSNELEFNPSGMKMGRNSRLYAVEDKILYALNKEDGSIVQKYVYTGSEDSIGDFGVNRFGEVFFIVNKEGASETSNSYVYRLGSGGLEEIYKPEGAEGYVSNISQIEIDDKGIVHLIVSEIEIDGFTVDAGYHLDVVWNRIHFIDRHGNLLDASYAPFTDRDTSKTINKFALHGVGYMYLIGQAQNPYPASTWSAKGSYYWEVTDPSESYLLRRDTEQFIGHFATFTDIVIMNRPVSRSSFNWESGFLPSGKYKFSARAASKSYPEGIETTNTDYVTIDIDVFYPSLPDVSTEIE